MKQFTLNIGLNVGLIEPKTQEDRTFYHVNQLFNNTNTTVKSNLGGSWGKERIVIVSGETNLSRRELKELLKDLCTRLSQDAIAFTYGENMCGIAFNREYKGEVFEFDNEYFVAQ